ncbi:MAG TPA: TlpA disulfide reductase family protein [Terriglobales bacterium]|nr:TlpA disulfide reductase family protein [Terriglobales bacterium]
MSITSRAKLAASIVLAILGITLLASGQSVEDTWDATVTVNNVSVPFRIEIDGAGADVHSYFFNGDDRVNPSNSGTFQNGSLVLNFDSYATKLEATLKDGELIGTYGGASGSAYSFQAKRHDPAVVAASDQSAPDISGLWEIQVKSPKGESAWHFVVNQAGAKVDAAILRVDGDTGILSGNYKDGKFALSHFTGERPFYVEVTPRSDGSLQLQIASFHDTQTLVALRSAEARARNLAPPDDPTQHTNLKDPSQPLRFSFPDLNGRIVSNTDEQFQGKVVLVNITGSWCPNCHDEAPFLEELYKKYHAQGFEIVALDFEPAEQLKSLSRARAFIKRYGIEYTYLIAGEPSQLNEKISQAENLNAWPTTFFVGRNGLVRSVHTGFTSQASGEFDSRLKDDVRNEIAQLLSENIHVAKGGN